MSKIQVKFVKEVDVDLNAYYESFPRPLRAAIDDALFVLLGGQQVTKKRSGQKRLTYNRLAQAHTFRLTKKSGRIGSRTSALLADLRRLNGGDVVSKEEVVKAAMQHKLSIASVIHNMVQHGQLEVVN
jgi:hypothetical protein